VKDQPKEPNLLQTILRLQGSQEAGREAIEQAGLPFQVAMLRTWQSERLRRTYADLLTDPQYGPASRFFLSDIYAPRDFSQRDHDFERLHIILSRYLPASMLSALKSSIDLNRTSHMLDALLLEVLITQLGVTDHITPDQYAEAYRRCDNYPTRVEQIGQMAATINEVALGARLLFTGPTLKALRLPAERLGWVEVYDFLERGYQAFRTMRKPKFFVDTIHDRELALLDHIYAGGTLQTLFE